MNITNENPNEATWPDPLQSQILAEAVRIGAELLSLAHDEGQGLFWRTLSINWQDNKQVRWRPRETIYSGVSGIALFFLELYKQTQNSHYLDTAVSAMRWVIHYCQNNPTHYYAFLTGRLGVAYTCLQMAQVTQDSHYLHQANHIARPCAAFLEAPNRVDDFINGTAGSILALLHLHAALGEKWILETIDLFVTHLVSRAQPGPIGLYWDRSFSNISGLCGFSHGAAGIGFVFLELGHYFRDDTFYWLAEQAFLYESHFFEPTSQNWPDLRKAIYEPHNYERYQQAYLAGKLSDFYQAQDMNMWCHGAAGIGLSRLRAFELTHNPLYAHEAKIAIQKTRHTDLENGHAALSPILCHGTGGNAELFLEAYKTFKDPTYLTLARQVGANALNIKKQMNLYLSGYGEYAPHTEDLSLFMGTTGVGYFYLKLCQPHTVPSIMLPRVASRGENGRVHLPSLPTAPLLPRHIISHLMGRTLFVLEQFAPQAIHTYFQDLPANRRVSIKESFIQLAQTLLPTLPSPAHLYLADTLHLEGAIIKMEEAMASHALVYIKDQVYTQQAHQWANLDDQQLLTLSLTPNPDSQVITTQWAWPPHQPDEWASNFQVEADEQVTLLKPTTNGVFITPLPPLVHTILIAFQPPADVGAVLHTVSQAFGDVSAGQAPTIRAAILQQIREMIQAKMLVAG